MHLSLDSILETNMNESQNMSLSTRIDDSLHCTFIYVVANEARISCHVQVCSSTFVPNVMNCKLVISVYICITCIALNEVLLCACVYNEQH